jgi:hypothetical protein
MAVANTDTMMPRMVFDGPNMDWPSKKSAPQSSGRGKRIPEELLDDDRCPVDHDQQDEELQDQDSLHGASPIDGPASRLNPRANLQAAI